jgi:hypothetical protein
METTEVVQEPKYAQGVVMAGDKEVTMERNEDGGKLVIEGKTEGYLMWFSSNMPGNILKKIKIAMAECYKIGYNDGAAAASELYNKTK